MNSWFTERRETRELIWIPHLVLTGAQLGRSAESTGSRVDPASREGSERDEAASLIGETDSVTSQERSLSDSVAGGRSSRRNAGIGSRHRTQRQGKRHLPFRFEFARLSPIRLGGFRASNGVIRR
ncbi:hypothetical protein [Cohnella faecalis]|uniref:Uncharacterized protein n=1 Tax=Cohnella faecalis TaxID=2315694 RepID=A0A398CS78_9BACL|nr:hypothetical protein [Cohnella faecalis]RIE05455.1 hypothetical protein D3H35_00380 [Cohnella faecalis]